MIVAGSLHVAAFLLILLTVRRLTPLPVETDGSVGYEVIPPEKALT